MPRSYSVRRSIDAPTDTVWEILTDGGSYPSWNSSVIRLDGDVSDGETIELLAAVNPKRAFKLSVSIPHSPASGADSASMV